MSDIRLSGIRLVVQGDDLGMCRAVNEGIESAATEGILTQTSVMASAPWFGEGAAMVTRRGLATGLHVTFTCEWEFLRWCPLTPGASLRGADGTFHRTVDSVVAKATETDAVEEARAQARRATDAGLTLTYVDPHMGVSIKSAYEAVCTDLGVSFIYPGVRPHHVWESFIILSTAPVEERAQWFVDRLDRIGPGTHFVLSHPGVAGDELRALTPPDADNVDWAERYRVADLDALCDPDVRRLIEKRGIELVAVSDL